MTQLNDAPNEIEIAEVISALRSVPLLSLVVRRLAFERDSLLQDAKRYHHLKKYAAYEDDCGETGIFAWVMAVADPELKYIDSLDAAIDAAIAQENENETY
jgi:uncharacterized protein YbcV (DUF1398 family)